MTPESQASFRKAISIDPETGVVVLAKTITYRPGMAESEIQKLPGCRQCSSLGDTLWYKPDNLDSRIGTIESTACCKNGVLVNLDLVVGHFPRDAMSHQRHRGVLEANLGPPARETEITERLYDCYPPPFTHIPMWLPPWGDAFATYNGRWDYCYILIRYWAEL